VLGWLRKKSPGWFRAGGIFQATREKRCGCLVIVSAGYPSFPGSARGLGRGANPNNIFNLKTAPGLFNCGFSVHPKNGSSVTPAQAGVQNWFPRFGAISWIPACAGMTVFIAHP
jgi:hypothetical protein